MGVGQGPIINWNGMIHLPAERGEKPQKRTPGLSATVAPGVPALERSGGSGGVRFGRRGWEAINNAPPQERSTKIGYQKWSYRHTEINHDYLVNDDLPNWCWFFLTHIVGTVEIEMSFVGFTPTGPQHAFIQHDMSWIGWRKKCADI